MMGIYSIKNKINGKIYIGQTQDIDKRWNQHINNLNKNKHINIYLQNAWNKYGQDNFDFNVIEITNTKIELNDKESYYIKLYKSNNSEYGYNLTNGGEGYSLNEDVKERISLSKRGQNSNLTEQQVRHIKMALYCLIDRKEICKIFNTTPKVITQIAMGKSFGYVCEELNESIHNLKQKLIDERNENILKLFDEGNKIIDIVRITGYTNSIVEKCVYKFRNCVDEKRKNIKRFMIMYLNYTTKV